MVKTVATGSLSKSGNTTLSLTVPGSGVAAGNTLVVAVSTGTFRGTVGCQDSKGNAYAVRADATGAGRLFVCTAERVRALTGGDTITVTYPGFSGTSMATAAEFSGLTGADQGRASAANTSTPTTGTVSTTRSSELLIAVVAHGGSTVYTPGCGFTLGGRSAAGSGGGQKTLDVVYRTVSATGSYEACGALSTSSQWQAAIVTNY
jgi:hypothetical protein